MGADFIEPDLVSTKDGVLIARHENEIGGTTDVADRSSPIAKRTKTVDGQCDHRLVHRGLHARRDQDAARARAARVPLARLRRPVRDPDLRRGDRAGADARAASAAGRSAIYPETKHPTYFRSIGLPLEETLLASLQKHGWNRTDAPVFIQSFEAGNLRALRGKTTVRLIQLVRAAGDGRRRRA